jgi:hypothetical protein
MLNAEVIYAECHNGVHYAEFHYAECCDTNKLARLLLSSQI